MADTAVAAASHGERGADRAPEGDDPCDVGRVGDAHDRVRPVVDPTGEHGPDLVVAIVVRTDHRTGHGGSQVAK